MVRPQVGRGLVVQRLALRRRRPSLSVTGAGQGGEARAGPPLGTVEDAPRHDAARSSPRELKDMKGSKKKEEKRAFRPLGGRETRSCKSLCKSLLRPFQNALEMIPEERLAPKKVISSEMEVREMHLIFTWRRA